MFRKIVAIVLFTLVTLLTLQFWATPVFAAPSTAPQTLLVKFAPSVSESERAAVIAHMGGTLVRWLAPLSTAQVQVSAAGNARAGGHAAAIARSSAGVEAVEFDGLAQGVPIVPEGGLAMDQGNRTIPPASVPINDPDFNDPTRVYAPQIIQAPQAWGYTLGLGDVIVAVIDSGVDRTHPDLAHRVLDGYDFVNNDGDPADDHGHGTHVAGIIAAAANNGIGSAGICPNCSILPVKVLDASNVGTWSNVAAGILYAVDHGARVINLSLGGNSNVQVVEDAIDYALTKGVVVVAAAGNGRTDRPFYPAALPSVISVGATRNDDTRWSLSNFGDWIDVAAPGYAIFSTYNDPDNAYGGYTFMSGTSMAAPHVAGLAGLLLSQDGQRTPADVRTLITGNADDLGDPGRDVYFGQGRINAFAALQAGAPAPVANARLGGRIWQDDNANGVWEQGEAVIDGSVTVEVRDRQGGLLATVEAGPQGRWQAENLYAGEYTVTAIPSHAVRMTTTPRYDVTLADGQAVDDLNFGIAAMDATGFAYRTFLPMAVNGGR